MYWNVITPAGCRIDGSDLIQPFECPYDNILRVEHWEHNEERLGKAQLYLPRPPAFLKSPHLSPAVRNSQLTVRVVPHEEWAKTYPRQRVCFKACAGDSDPLSLCMRDCAGGVTIPEGATGAQLRQMLDGARGARVLRVIGAGSALATPGKDASAPKDFNDAMAEVLPATWCCNKAGTRKHKLPEPLTGRREDANVAIEAALRAPLDESILGSGANAGAATTGAAVQPEAGSALPVAALGGDVPLADYARTVEHDAPLPGVPTPAQTLRPESFSVPLVEVVRRAHSEYSHPATFVAFGTISAKAQVLNWVDNMLRRNLLSHVVVAMDDQLHAALLAAGVSTYHLDCGLGNSDVRGSEEGFRQLGMCKVAFLYGMLARGVHVVLSDNDALWLRDPVPYLLDPKWTSAHIFISTDCLGAIADAAMTGPAPSEKDRGVSTDGGSEVSMRLKYGAEGDLSKLPWYAHPRLGGHAWERNGNIVESAFNTGMLFFRASAETLQFAREWVGAMDDAMQAFRAGKQMHVRDDQQAFNNLIRDHFLPPKVVVPQTTARIFRAHAGKLALLIMPLSVVANGHTYFAQRSSQVAGLVPYGVHNTYNFHGSDGKEARFREAGLWADERAARGAALAQAASGASAREKFLTWAPGVPIEVLAPAGKQTAPAMAHMRAVAYQLLSMRNAAAYAKVLNRTLVVPPMMCYCDRYYNVIAGGDSPEKASCRAPGSDLVLPFVCPMDYLIDPGSLDKAGLRWRSHAFLGGGHTGGDAEPGAAALQRSTPRRLPRREVSVALNVAAASKAVDDTLALWGITAEIRELLAASGAFAEGPLLASTGGGDGGGGLVGMVADVRMSETQAQAVASVGGAAAAGLSASGEGAAGKGAVLTALQTAADADVLVLSSAATAACGDDAKALGAANGAVQGIFTSMWCCTPKGTIPHNKLPAMDSAC